MEPLLSVTCTDDERRHDVADAASTFNGIDWVEVDPADQRILHVGFLHPLPGETGGVPASPALGPSNVVIEGGERIRNIGVVSVTAATDVLTVTVDHAGDFSPYALRIVRSPADHSAPKNFDPVLSARLFSFKANCPSDLDCEPPALGAPRVGADPIVDYLAKDYDGFRRLMLDRLAQLVPGWTERNPADPARHRRRGARPHRRPHVVPPGRRRHRGVPRHGAQPHLRAPPRPPARLPRCTRAARRAPGCTSR